MAIDATSRIQGFSTLRLSERRQRLATAIRLSTTQFAAFSQATPLELADAMIENAIGTFSLPFGVALNFRVNGRDHLIPMVVEEPSVVAAASSAALLVRSAGGFACDVDESLMAGQIFLVRLPEPAAACRRLEAARMPLLAEARRLTPGLCRRGAGPRDISIRLIPGEMSEPSVVVHVLVDTGDAMGANVVNSLVEQLAPTVEEIAGGFACLRIVSNLADRRLARASVRVPVGQLARPGLEGCEVAARIALASEFAAIDPYRAATHNKGIMNGVDAVAVATGNDWRAIEAGAHAYACRDGRYRALSGWTVDDDCLCGTMELPLAVSTVGPLVQAHPGVGLGLRLLGISRARELASVMVAVGLASNLAALRALVTDGIQKGHMALHARRVALSAGKPAIESSEHDVTSWGGML